MNPSERSYLITKVVDFGVAKVCYLRREESSTESKYITIPKNCSLESVLALTEKYPIFSVQITGGKLMVLGKISSRSSWKIEEDVKYRVILDHNGTAIHCSRATNLDL